MPVTRNATHNIRHAELTPAHPSNLLAQNERDLLFAEPLLLEAGWCRALNGRSALPWSTRMVG